MTPRLSSRSRQAGIRRQTSTTRPSATLHRSTPYVQSRRRRSAVGGVGAGSLLLAAGGLGAVLAGAAYAAPQTSQAVPAHAGSPSRGAWPAQISDATRRVEAQQAAAQQAAARHAVAVAAQRSAAAAAAGRAASRAQDRIPLAPLGGAAVGPSFTGLASWYGPGFDGLLTASGTRYDENAMTAASRTLPLGTHLRVCRGSTCVVVLINDWGPAPRSRVLDLSRAAAERLDLIGVGVGEVTATPVAA